MIKREKIVVIGRGTALEHEICNLGRSLGHEMVSVSRMGRPQNSEPWVAGIEWIEQPDIMSVDSFSDVLTDSFAVVLCDLIANNDFQGDRQVRAQNVQNTQNTQSRMQQIADAVEKAGAAKFVWVRTTDCRKGSDAGSVSGGDQQPDSDLVYYKEAEDDLLSRSFRATIFRPTVIFGQGIAMDIEDGGFIEALPLELVAMAALRASLEPDTTGIMEREAIEFYGDAMMIQ